jgi:Gram-negative bacterial TonB protein C-terminal
MPGTLALSLFLSWVQVSSDTYIVKSSAGEERARHVLTELEHFHQLVGTLVFRNTELPELPIEVLLIGDEQTMKELEPDYNGRKVPVAGYYQRGNDRDFIVLSGRVFPQTLTNVVYHELTHYFLARALAVRPTWLNEGLSEYFAMAEIRDDTISLGRPSPDRMQLLKTASIIPLKTFFAVDTTSSYYNESAKANVFYVQAWAFVQYVMHGEYAARFKNYIDALTKGDADLFEYLGVSERDLETGFNTYVKVSLPRTGRTVMKASGEQWTMNIHSIPDTEAQISMAEIFLANGRVTEARRHLEILSTTAPDSTRVSYYRGVLAKIAGNPNAREFFIDALLDSFLAPRAAVQLVESGELHIPAVRAVLEMAASATTRNAEVYLALTKIYSDDVHRIEEAVRVSRTSAESEIRPRVPAEAGDPEPQRRHYARVTGDHYRYDLFSESENQPRVERFVAPYYPLELTEQKASGEVIVDVQITSQGDVGGMWFISAMPDVFATLATAAIREWKFEPEATKLRIVLTFLP